MEISRRQFIILSAAGLSIGLGGCRNKTPGATLDANAVHAGTLLTLTSDNRLLLMQDKMEMGQGIATATAALVATELGVALDDIELLSSSPGVAGGNPYFVASWGTGGSSSVSSSWQALRAAGGLLRHLLLQAAARAWQQDVEQLRIDGKTVRARAGERHASFAQLIPHIRASDSDRYQPPQTPIRSINQGQLTQRAMVRGSHAYSIDLKLPGMLNAVLLRALDQPPALPAAASAAGIRAVHISNGVALVGPSLWTLLQLRAQLAVPAAGTAQDINAALTQALDSPGAIGAAQGRSMPASAPTLSADYHVPYLAHAAMEPLSCLVSVGEQGCELWLGTQRPVDAQQLAASLCGLPTTAVRVHTHAMGGAFGRRLVQDFVREAVELGKALKQPVKLTWTREDDMRHGVYRSAASARMQAWFDDANQLTACHFRVADTAHGAAPAAVDNARAQWQTRLLGKYDGDLGALHGLTDISYRIGSWRSEHCRIPGPLRTGLWRSVAHSYTAFFLECFVDELAAHAGLDPLQWRLAHLPEDDGLRAVLDAAVRRAGWPEAGSGSRFGLASHRCFGSNVALVARVSGDAAAWRVTDLYCAVECGQLVNEDGVRAQVEGGLLFGLGAALYGAITSDPHGAVIEGNFDRYRVLRMLESPRIHVDIVRSERAPSGIGEPPVPVVAPAVANALAALTGARPRALPLQSPI